MASAVWYGQGVLGLVSATAARRFDWDNDTFKVSLHTSAYAPNQDTDNFLDDLNNEIFGNGYARQTLVTGAPTYDTATNHVQLPATNSTFTATGAGWTHRYIVVWKDTGVAATSPLLGYVDTLGQSVPAGNYVVDWDDTDGVLSFNVV